MATSNSSSSKTVITPEAMLSYPHLFEPVTNEQTSKQEYSCCLVFAPGIDLTTLRQAAHNAATERWADKVKGLFQAGQLRLPFRTDAEEKGYTDGSTFVNVKTTRKPGIVSIFAGPDGKPQPITDPDEVYPGCYVRASLRAFAYDTSGNKGVSFALGNIQKLRDGERLDSYRRAQDEFEALETAPNPEFGPAPDGAATPSEAQVAALAGKSVQAAAPPAKPAAQPPYDPFA